MERGAPEDTRGDRTPTWPGGRDSHLPREPAGRGGWDRPSVRASFCPWTLSGPEVATPRQFVELLLPLDHPGHSVLLRKMVAFGQRRGECGRRGRRGDRPVTQDPAAPSGCWPGARDAPVPVSGNMAWGPGSPLGSQEGQRPIHLGSGFGTPAHSPARAGLPPRPFSTHVGAEAGATLTGEDPPQGAGPPTEPPAGQCRERAWVQRPPRARLHEGGGPKIHWSVVSRALCPSPPLQARGAHGTGFCVRTLFPWLCHRQYPPTFLLPCLLQQGHRR